jgi:hypothetical protein
MLQLIGVLGYLSFGSNVGTNIITMYPSASLFVCFGRLSIVILTLCSYPLQVSHASLSCPVEAKLGLLAMPISQVHPCRAALDKVFSRHPAWNNAGETHVNQGEQPYHDNPSADPEQIGRSGDALLERSVSSPRQEEMSLQKLCVLTGLILASTFLIAILVDDLGLVLGFVGSVGSTSISFIVSLYEALPRKCRTHPPPRRFRITATRHSFQLASQGGAPEPT